VHGLRSASPLRAPGLPLVAVLLRGRPRAGRPALRCFVPNRPPHGFLLNAVPGVVGWSSPAATATACVAPTDPALLLALAAAWGAGGASSLGSPGRQRSPAAKPRAAAAAAPAAAFVSPGGRAVAGVPRSLLSWPVHRVRGLRAGRAAPLS
jgi:hypothetical protein